MHLRLDPCLRAFTLLGLFWRTALAAELEYRINLLVSVVVSMGSTMGSLFGLFLFYRGGYEFAGWNWLEALLVLGIFTVFQGLTSMWLSPNLNRISQHVQQGTLDFILLKPISSQFWLSTRVLSPWGIPDLLLGCSLILYTAFSLHLRLTDILLGLIPLLSGIASFYSLWFMVGATSIWLVKIYNATEVLRGLVEAGRFPISAYPTAYRFFFTFILPVAFLTTVPAETFLGRGSLAWICLSVGLAVTLLILSQHFWRFALRFYTSASS